MMRPLLLILLLATTALSGCTSDDADPGDSDAATDGSADATESNQQAATGPPMLEFDDPWGEMDELVLIDSTESPSPFFVDIGCHRMPFGGFPRCLVAQPDDGTLLPVGTESLHVSVVANDDGVGGLHAQVFTAGRNPTTHPEMGSDPHMGPEEFEWTFELIPEDWDHPRLNTSALIVAVWNDGQAGVFGSRVGTFDVTVTAIRDPEWTMTPVVDAWSDPANRTFTPEGSMVLLDQELDLDRAGNHQGEAIAQQEDTTPIHLDAPVPLGVDWLTVGIRDIAISGCTPSQDCLVDANYHSGAGTLATYSAAREDMESSTRDWIILTLPAEWVHTDNPWGEQSGTWLDGQVNACPPEAVSGASVRSGCTQNSLDIQFSAQYMVEAWKGEPDLDAFKERLGVA